MNRIAFSLRSIKGREYIYRHVNSNTPYYTTTKHFTTSPPNSLPPHHLSQITSFIRVNHAGEIGANYIYKAQLQVFKHHQDLTPILQEMLDHEERHLRAFEELLREFKVRQSVLVPVWKVAGYLLGGVTALLGKEAAMACTEAVETAVGEHYDNQIKSLQQMPTTPTTTKLIKIFTEFRDEELNHKQTAIQHDSEKAPLRKVLSAVIDKGCKGAIWVAERI